MNIKLTQAAQEQMAVIRDTAAIETGFITGWEIGKHRIIQGFFPLKFNPATLDEVYAGIRIKMGAKLMGVFFNNIEPFTSDWFLEDLVILLGSPQPRFLLYNSDRQLTAHPGTELEAI